MNVTLHINGKPMVLEDVERKSGEVRFRLNGKTYHFHAQALQGGVMLKEETTEGVSKSMQTMISPGNKGAKRIQMGAWEATISEAQTASAGGATQNPLSPPAPMPGVVRQIFVKKGDKVTEGQPLVMIEAMKLQLTLSAGADAMVEAVLVAENDMVAEGAELVRLKEIK